jgi:hypothetical protein
LRRSADRAPLAGKSTLNRLELRRPEATRYHKISHDPAAIEALFVDRFLESHAKAPGQIILDLMRRTIAARAARGRFFHGHYDCYRYLPLYVFCGRHLLAAKLRRRTSTARRARWRRWRGSLPASAAAGHGHAFCCAGDPASPVKP